MPPEQDHPPAPEALNHWRQRLEIGPDSLWDEAKAHVQLHQGLLIIDDSRLDKPYAKKIDRVSRQRARYPAGHS